MHTIRRKKIYTLLVLCGQLLLFSILRMYGIELNYKQMSILALSQISLDIILLKVCGLAMVSVPNMFSVFSLLFHCGQIIKIGFNIKGTVPIPFENYATQNVIQMSFFFYIMSQGIYYFAVLMGYDLDKKTHLYQNILKKGIWSVDSAVCGKILLLIGFIPRIYIDILTLVGARNLGYVGVYSLYIPGPIQAIAFFFEAGLIFMLFSIKKTSNRTFLFIAVILYKCLMMTTGSRQDKVAFLLVWIYIFYFLMKKISLKKIIYLILFFTLGFVFISAVGAVRSGSSLGIHEIFSVIQSGKLTDLFGSALGEFGAALDTLELAIQYTPANISYGFGRSYVAGIISIIPLLVNQIPFLAKTTIFLSQLPDSLTFAFGGSYLGELYYNFSWFGVLGSYFIGWLIIKLHCNLVEENNVYVTKKCFNAIVAISMILFVRGYFTDMVQKIVWLYIVIFIISIYLKSNKDTKKQNY